MSQTLSHVTSPTRGDSVTPDDRGADVNPREVGEYHWVELGGERGERASASWRDGDADLSQAARERGVRDWIARSRSREEPDAIVDVMKEPSCSSSCDHRFGDDAEFIWEVEVVCADPDPSQPVDGVDLIKGDLCDAVRANPVQQDQRGREPRACKDGVVSEDVCEKSLTFLVRQAPNSRWGRMRAKH